MNGWNVDLLQKAVDDCDAASGLLEECPHLKTHDLNTEEHTYSPVCRKTPVVDEIVQDVVLESLPGRNPVQWGPEDVTFPPEKSAPPTFKRSETLMHSLPCISADSSNRLQLMSIPERCHRRGPSFPTTSLRSFYTLTGLSTRDACQ